MTDNKTQLVFLIRAPKHITEEKDMAINTYDGEIINTAISINIDRIERKKNCRVNRKIIKDGICYKYSVEAFPDVKKCVLNVFIGRFENNSMNWKCSFSAEAKLGNYDSIKKQYEISYSENGDCDISFWHEFFATRYLEDKYFEKNVNFYEEYDSMKELRKVFRMQLMPNPFLSFERFKTLSEKGKKYHQPEYDIRIFDIPKVKINRNAGKANNSLKFNEKPEFMGKYFNVKSIELNGVTYGLSYFAQQREVEIDGIVFLDVVCMEGAIIDGIMNERESHRFFIGDDYWFSPDGGDIGVFANAYVCGNVFWNKMKKNSNLMLERYNGRYPYLYVFSKYYIPCFEILAKAGYTEIADMMVDSWLETKDCTRIDINLFGKNDREIFGFKLSKFRNIDKSSYYTKHYSDNSDFYYLINGIKFILKKNPLFFDENGHIEPELFSYAQRGIFDTDKNTIKYIRKQGVCFAEMYGDYINMCRQSKWSSGGQFPVNLKASHDLMVSYMNQLKEAKNNQQFSNTVSTDSYKELLYEEEEYCILAPRVANDLLIESRVLKHCVRSYISNVATGSTKIYFLRKKEEKGRPLVTIEVHGRYIHQARGSCNRSVSKEEDDFIKRWAECKSLIASYSCYLY